MAEIYRLPPLLVVFRNYSFVQEYYDYVLRVADHGGFSVSWYVPTLLRTPVWIDEVSHIHIPPEAADIMVFDPVPVTLRLSRDSLPALRRKWPRLDEEAQEIIEDGCGKFLKHRMYAYEELPPANDNE